MLYTAFSSCKKLPFRLQILLIGVLGLDEYIDTGFRNQPFEVLDPLDGVDLEHMRELGLLAAGDVLSATNDDASALLMVALPHAGLGPDLFHPPLEPGAQTYHTYTQHQYALTERGRVDTLLTDLQDGRSVLRYNPQYFSNLLDHMSRTSPNIIQKVTVNDDPFNHFRYGLTAPGFNLVRPPAGWLLSWADKSGIPLYTALGAAKRCVLNPDGDIKFADSVIARLQVLAALCSRDYAPLTRRDVIQYNRGTIGKNATIHHLEALTANDLVIRDGVDLATYHLASPKIRYAMRKLLGIYRKMSELDPEFYHQGHILADEIISNPRKVRKLLRGFTKSKKPPSVVVNLGDFAAQKAASAN